VECEEGAIGGCLITLCAEVSVTRAARQPRWLRKGSVDDKTPLQGYRGLRVPSSGNRGQILINGSDSTSRCAKPLLESHRQMALWRIAAQAIGRTAKADQRSACASLLGTKARRRFRSLLFLSTTSLPSWRDIDEEVVRLVVVPVRISAEHSSRMVATQRYS